MNYGRNLKYSGEELAVLISHHLGALSDSKYIAGIGNQPIALISQGYLLSLIR